MILMSNRWFFVAVFSILYQAPCAFASASLETTLPYNDYNGNHHNDPDDDNMEPVLWQVLMIIRTM